MPLNANRRGVREDLVRAASDEYLYSLYYIKYVASGVASRPFNSSLVAFSRISQLAADNPLEKILSKICY
jgi:hypothetical protein